MNVQRTIVFYGDSIMDVERDNTNYNDLGEGFPKILSEKIIQNYGENNFIFYNSAIGGNQVKDLNFRINKECLALKPNIVILLIGINDVWDNQYNDSFGTDNEQTRFEKEYTKLLDTFKANNIQVIILDPYVLPYPKKRKRWRVDLDPKIQIIQKLARKYGYLHIELDEILNRQIPENKIQEYTGQDGVHPTKICHILIAEIVFTKIIKNNFLYLNK